ncbi:MAG: cobalamin biosynthesis protein CobD [Gemmatimonadales bacterium]|nr:MAG: cobalamin biosynthesis protein CobD [Gemmatimonadales bacterium]
MACLLADLVLGEPSPHPVRGIGALLNAGKRRRRATSPWGAFLEGLLVVGGTAALVGAGAAGVRRLAQPVPALEGILLKPALALGALLEAGDAVHGALEAGDLDEARRLTAWHLVSRDTAHLTASQVSSAVVESLSENLVDSVVAPAGYFLLGGLPAAWIYRTVNTADALFGYRSEEFEWFGKPAARADDLLNLAPARWTGAAILLAAGRPDLLPRLPREARRAQGPNAGWPMAAAALALGVRLEKPGSYVLNERGRPANPGDIPRATGLLRRATAVALAGLVTTLGHGP